MLTKFFLYHRVLQDISDSVVAIYTDKGISFLNSEVLELYVVLQVFWLRFVWQSGAHCLDLSTPTATDPDWLVSQQEKEVKIIGLWLAEYNARLISKADGRMG